MATPTLNMGILNGLIALFLGFLFCCVTFGLATNAAKEKGTYFKNFFASLGDVVMLLMEKFLLYVRLDSPHGKRYLRKLFLNFPIPPTEPLPYASCSW